MVKALTIVLSDSSLRLPIRWPICFRLLAWPTPVAFATKALTTAFNPRSYTLATQISATFCQLIYARRLNYLQVGGKKKLNEFCGK